MIGASLVICDVLFKPIYKFQNPFPPKVFIECLRKFGGVFVWDIGPILMLMIC